MRRQRAGARVAIEAFQERIVIGALEHQLCARACSASLVASVVLPTPIGPSSTMKRCAAGGGCSARHDAVGWLSETPDSAEVHPACKLRDQAAARYGQFRGHLGQRIQNEIALHYPRMRQAQTLAVQAQLREQQQVEIDPARAPALARRRAPERVLQLRAAAQRTSATGQLREQPGHSVDEIRLRRRPHGLGAVQRGTAPPAAVSGRPASAASARCT